MSNTAQSTASYTPPSLLLATIGLSLATFMQILDMTIANVSLATIAGNLGVSSDKSAWVITSFAVSNAIALPLTGWLSRRFGETRLFIGATLLFVASSLLCGLSRSMGMLIFCRVIQGATAGPLFPAAQSLLLSIYPPAKRGMALSLLSMIAVVAPLAGPLLGGAITENFSWPWIFFINVPVGIVAASIVWVQLHKRPEKILKTKIDYVGLVTLVLGVGALQIMLDKGNDLDWFDSGFIVALAVVAAISLSVFLIWELTEAHPIVNLRLFRHRNFATGTLTAMFGYGVLISSSLLVPLWLQTRMGYTAIWAGLAAAPVGLGPLLLAPLMGRYAHRVDLRLLVCGAFFIIGCTAWMRASFNLDVDFKHVALAQLIQGIGTALYFMPILSILLSDLEPHEISDGSGLTSFARTLGGSFAISLATFMWQHRADMHHARLVEHLTPYDAATREALQTMGNGDPVLGAAALNQAVTAQAYMMSTVDYFTLLAVVSMGLILLVWLTKPPFTPKGAAPVEH